MGSLVPVGNGSNSQWGDEERALVPANEAASLERCRQLTESSLMEINKMQIVLLREMNRMKEETAALKLWREDAIARSQQLLEKSRKSSEVHKSVKEESLESMKKQAEKEATDLEASKIAAENKKKEMEEKIKSLQAQIKQNKGDIAVEARNGQAIQNAINALRRK